MHSLPPHVLAQHFSKPSHCRYHAAGKAMPYLSMVKNYKLEVVLVMVSCPTKLISNKLYNNNKCAFIHGSSCENIQYSLSPQNIAPCTQGSKVLTTSSVTKKKKERKTNSISGKDEIDTSIGFMPKHVYFHNWIDAQLDQVFRFILKLQV